MTTLWPQLLEPEASRLAEDEGSGPLQQTEWELDRSKVRFDHHGGVEATFEHLTKVVEVVRALANECGYPERSLEGRQRFDRACGPLLVKHMAITPHQATREGIWRWLACVALPDLVRWRFRAMKSTGRVNPERFLRLNRNLLGRLWWRAHLLRDDAGPDPWHLLNLSEDNMVAIFERTTSIASCRSMILAFGRSCVGLDHDRRMPVMRDATKRVLRLLPAVPLRCLPADDVAQHVREAFGQSLRQVSTREKSRVAEE